MFHNCRTNDEVKKIFRKLSMYLHPDKGGSEELMIMLQEARNSALLGIEAYNQGFEAADIEHDNKKHTTIKKYSKVYDDINDGDEELNIISEIFEYAKSHKRFSTDFVESVEEFIDEKGYVTSNQYNSLVRVYYSFRMDKESE